MSKAIEFAQCCPLCGKEFSEEKIGIKLADIISRKQHANTYQNWQKSIAR